MFIDTHTHLYSDNFDVDRDDMIQRAVKVGVERLLMPNIDSKSISGLYKLEQQYPDHCIPMMGLHPCSVQDNWEDELELIRQELFSRKFIAVGEIGIDLYWDKTFLKEQKKVFALQIEWAKMLNIPIVIHARSSFNEIFDVLDECNNDSLSGVFHCFTGNVEELNKIRSYGSFYIGLGGVLTFKNSGLDSVLKEMKPTELLLETDSPYLAPVPHRGKRNESSYVPIIADKVSDILEIPISEVEKITTENAKKCFNLD